MKKTYLIIIALSLTVVGLCQDSDAPSDSSAISPIHGLILIGNKGFAPIPAFSFEDPIAMIFLSLGNGRFTYHPDLAVGFNGKPWITNHWLRYKVARKERVAFNVGVTPSLFFFDAVNDSGDDILQVWRSATTEAALSFKVKEKWTMKLTHWYGFGFDKGTLNGNFFNLTSALSGIPIGGPVYLNMVNEIFYFNFNEEFKGSFFNTVLDFGYGKAPILVHFQGAQPIWTNFSGKALKWNFGVVYLF